MAMTKTAAKDAKSAKANALSHEVIGAAIEVHRLLGPGLMESAYEQCLAHELHLRNIAFERQETMPVEYKGVAIDCGFRIDLLIDECLILELKAVEQFNAVHEAQLLTYLRITQCKLGLLMNFNVKQMRQGIRRLALDL